MVRPYKYSSPYLTHHFEVPVVAVFTKYDQFLSNVEMDVLDYPNEYPDGNVSEVAEKRFQEHYLYPLGDNIGYVLLESGFRLKLMPGLRADVAPQKCTCKIGAATILLRKLPLC